MKKNQDNTANQKKIILDQKNIEKWKKLHQRQLRSLINYRKKKKISKAKNTYAQIRKKNWE